VARLTIHFGLSKALIVAASVACAVPMSANASVTVATPVTVEAYSGTVAGYNFDTPPPYVSDASVRRDASGDHLPEPATWAMMILGFFGLSFAVRGRGRSRGDKRKSRARVRYS
jgi:hypothetical protein